MGWVQLRNKKLRNFHCPNSIEACSRGAQIARFMSPGRPNFVRWHLMLVYRQSGELLISLLAARILI
jgi:hypothetical protein